MQPAPDDKLAASVFALGLALGFVRREDLVRWADQRIAAADSPPPWLLDLSLSHNQHLLDLIGDLKQVGEGVEPVATCEAAFALLPDVTHYSFDQAEALAKRLYEITRGLAGDLSNDLFRTVDNLDDSFGFVRGRYTNMSEDEAVRAVQCFVNEHRSDEVARLLYPVQWSPETTEVPQQATNASGEVVLHVGIASWIIQDGNYTDFTVGQEPQFALEFYAPHGLQPVTKGRLAAGYLANSRYRIRGRVVFRSPTVWVIDTDWFVAYQEHEPPPHAVIGTLVEGDIYLGIDPFSYFEYLHRMSDMPPLMYKWRVQKVLREITPWIEAKDANGRPYQRRDENRESFVPAKKTDAWHDDGGNAHYVLTCLRASGPNRP